MSDVVRRVARRRLAAGLVALLFVGTLFLSPPTLVFTQFSVLGPEPDGGLTVPVTTRMDLGDAKHMQTIPRLIQPWIEAGPYQGPPDLSRGSVSVTATMRHPDLQVPVDLLVLFSDSNNGFRSVGSSLQHFEYLLVKPDGTPDKEGGDTINVAISDPAFAQQYWFAQEEANAYQGFVVAKRYLAERDKDGDGQPERVVALSLYLSEGSLDRPDAFAYMRATVTMKPEHDWNATNAYTEAAGRMIADLVPALFKQRDLSPFLGVQIMRDTWWGALLVPALVAVPLLAVAFQWNTLRRNPPA